MSSGGLLLVYEMQQCLVQYEMAEIINTTTATDTLRLTPAQYQANRAGGHEISFGGKLYDIKSSTTSGNLITLVVVNDSREENILEKIKGLLHNTGKDNSGLPVQLHKLLSLVYISPANPGIMTLDLAGEDNFFSYNEHTLTCISEVVSPPPQVA